MSGTTFATMRKVLATALVFISAAAVIVAMVTIFKPTASPITAPLYAVLEGAALGSLSMAFELKYPGIVVTAVMSTFVVVMVMLVLWKMKLIVPTARFRSIVVGATGAICVLYLLDFVMHLFNMALLPQTGAVSIGISLIVCLIASLSLILDFENIQIAVDQGLPKYFEYFNAFSLLVTICWLYIEKKCSPNRGTPNAIPCLDYRSSAPWAFASSLASSGHTEA